MKKILFLCLAVFIIVSAGAQNNEPAPLLKSRANVIKDYNYLTSISPIKLPILPEAKSGITRIPFGSSFSMSTLLSGENNNFVYNQDIGVMMFSHIAGGPYGGTDGDVRCHFTGYFGSNIDSVVFVQQGNNKLRYPNGVIYNPLGNTNPDNAMAIITGHVKNGNDVTANYFCTQKLDGSLAKYHFEPTYDTFKPVNINLTLCDGGKVVVAGQNLSYLDAGLTDGIFYFKSGQVQGDSVAWNTNTYKFATPYQLRHFSNDTTSWAFNPNMAFSQDGMTGYFFVFGLEASDNAINSGPKPIIWKTINGGTTWTKLPTLDLSTLNGELKKWIKPTRITLDDDTSLMVYRPGIMAGATTEETNFPGIVDMNGNLHIACQIEGMYSSNIDSLNYSYQYNPWYVFDLHTTSTGWSVKMVDTINADVDKVTFTDHFLDHSFHLAKTADESKIFFTWTDTDMDTSNYMPDVYARAFDLSSGNSTHSKKETVTGDYYLYNAPQQVVDSNGAAFYMPASYANFTGTTTATAPTHVFVKGFKFSIAEFDPSFSINESSVTINDINVSPNPANDHVNVIINIDRASDVNLSVYNLLGVEVLARNYGKLTAGDNRLKINTSNLASGIYFLKVQAGKERITKKIVIE